MPQNMPQEIIDLILKELCAKLKRNEVPGTLRSCSSVSRAFRELSQKHLFEEISFYFSSNLAYKKHEGHHIIQLHTIFLENSSLCTFVRHLELDLWPVLDEPEGVYFAQVLRMMTWLRSVHIYDRACGGNFWGKLSIFITTLSHVLGMASLNEVKLFFCPFGLVELCLRVPLLVLHKIEYEGTFPSINLIDEGLYGVELQIQSIESTTKDLVSFANHLVRRRVHLPRLRSLKVNATSDREGDAVNKCQRLINHLSGQLEHLHLLFDLYKDTGELSSFTVLQVLGLRSNYSRRLAHSSRLIRSATSASLASY